MSSNSVSVVICAYTMDRFQDVCEAVESVLAQTLQPHEVIVAVDHNEELLGRLKQDLPTQAKLVLNDGPHRGSSATDNAGVAVATGDIVAFMDDDAVADKHWLERLVLPYKDSSVVSVGGRLIPVWQNGCPRWFCDEFNWVVGCTYKGHPEERAEVRNLIFCNASLRSDVFDKVGLFPAETGRVANWGTGFECQFYLRLKAQMPEGLVFYEPSAVVYHKVTPQRRSLGYLVRRCYNEGYHKAKIKRACAASSAKPLSTESSYLRHLLLNSIPSRLAHFYRLWAIPQAGAITLGTAATGMGYVKGRVERAT